MESLEIVGRIKEQATLKATLQSAEAELVAVTGRRRVGKTFLVKQVFQEQILFEITGLQDEALDKQLAHFRFTLFRYSQDESLQTPKDWLEAFQKLVLYLDKQVSKHKKVIFFDEVPWLASQKSDFLTGLGFFWNSWAVNHKVVLVICGSAASWMVEHVVDNKGGLHNRITKLVHLEPFTLRETELFLQKRDITLKRGQIVELYMALGGIPHYLKEVEAGKSAAQNIDHICFSKRALLYNEFSRLYAALFAHAHKHIAVIQALATSRQGLTREQIVSKTGLSNGGHTTRILSELEQSGFITVYSIFGNKKKDRLHRLTDEFSLFYLQFMESHRNEEAGTWLHLSQTQAYKIWCGYAFENLCLKHLAQIKLALGIAGVYSKASAFSLKGSPTEKGIQIDLLLDRKDNIINIFEIKFYNAAWTLTADDAHKLREKLRIFQQNTNTNKHLMLTLVAAQGLKQNNHSIGLVEKVLTLDDLFLE
ncbi:MAG TPA: ATP-binding protein [Saprospiraceae bacterium]|nr:ATP-binding protein [Saprospiraceae bacterium]HMQ82754.1 ATP-binding protein [Saprospiraceae bacterium]